MEEMTKNDVIDKEANSFVSNIKSQNDEIKSTLNNELSTDLKKSIKKVTNRTINVSLNDDIFNYLKKKNISVDLFDTFFMQKYIDDVYTFISYINTNGEDKLLELSDMKNINQIISKKYGISDEFVKVIMEFNSKKNGVGMGPGELGIALFFKGTRLAESVGDIMLNDKSYEVKAKSGKIPGTFQPDAALIRRTARRIIEKYVNINKDNLKSPELKDEFKDQRWLSLYVKHNYAKSTQSYLRSQFELINGKHLVNNDGKEIDAKTILKDILESIFDIYGEAGTYIIQNLDSIVENNFNINHDKLKQATIKSFVDFYTKESNFDYFIFFNYHNGSIRIIKNDDYDAMMNSFQTPSYGDREGQQQQKTVLSVK